MSRYWVRDRFEAEHPELADLVWDDVAQCWLVAANDGQGVWVMPLMYTSAIITGPVGAATYDDRWCYDDVRAALDAARAWGGPWNGGEPAGWPRHPATGRRREAGDPATEYVNH